MKASAWWCVAAYAVMIVGLAGCAAIEFGRRPPIPDITVIPNGKDDPTPPPLPAPPLEPIEKPHPEPGEPLRITVEAAIALALEHNQALQVETINPVLARTLVAEQRAVFDPTLAGAFARTRNELDRELQVRTPLTIPDGAGGQINFGNVPVRVDTETTNTTTTASAGIDQLLPTGTSISLSYSPSASASDIDSSSPNLVGQGNDTEADADLLELTVTQRLLRGGGLGVNLASLRQARLAYLSSEYNLRGFTESLVAQVENAYWDHYLAQRQIEIFEESLELAEAQAAEVEARIEVGKLAESERAAAEAEVAQRRSQLIDARSNLAQTRLTLVRLLNPTSDAMRSVDVELVSDPILPDIRLDEVEESLEFALRMRPELNQARLLIQQDNLEIVRTRNGLLPQLDLFLTLSREVNETEYGRNFEGNTRDLEDENFRADVGLQFSYPLGNRAARARHNRALFTREQDIQALANLAQLVEQDVRSAYIELSRAREQVTATEATRRLQELTAQTELEKFRVGKSTTLLVAQAQRDLLVAQIDEVQALTNYLKAIVNLYFLDGSLLLRRGVDCPGEQPVMLPDEAYRSI